MSALAGADHCRLEPLGCEAFRWRIRWAGRSVESDDDTTREFLEANIAGLESPWDDFIASALSMVVYGWAVFETVYQYQDARLWWRKFGDSQHCCTGGPACVLGPYW